MKQYWFHHRRHHHLHHHDPSSLISIIISHPFTTTNHHHHHHHYHHYQLSIHHLQSSIHHHQSSIHHHYHHHQYFHWVVNSRYWLMLPLTISVLRSGIFPRFYYRNVFYWCVNSSESLTNWVKPTRLSLHIDKIHKIMIHSLSNLDVKILFLSILLHILRAWVRIPAHGIYRSVKLFLQPIKLREIRIVMRSRNYLVVYFKTWFPRNCYHLLLWITGFGTISSKQSACINCVQTRIPSLLRLWGSWQLAGLEVWDHTKIYYKQLVK